MANAVKKLFPLLDRILIKRFEPVTKTAGGIVIPEKSQEKVQYGEVVAVGPGARKENGEHITPSVKVGDHVLLPEYGGTKIKQDGDEYQLFRETDILAKVQN